ncbi:hypothetical protein CC86DRAFT_406123 [Ophiobolus disseminans]|uniref:Zn(2)-C6 fungal-type domain-containing protein n=1 Tax=Ophiobolus disseminans TaxID=1469910 RepID=A0A6A7A0U5_9PLEO|nr:hypothetical protein CC86DRAFT_406123 [Ophiobolus disseminans]
MANFRALQPARMDEEASPPLPQSRPLLIQKPKRTVTLGACVACRKRKSKCDGNRPICTCCTQKDTGCVYELGPNEKPSQAMKRKNEEMQGELSNLRQLYDSLRLQPEQEAMEILRRIRADPLDTPSSQRIQELADFARHGGTIMQQPSHTPPSPQQNYLGNLVTLPSIRLALEAQYDQSSDILPFPGISSMGSEGPSTRRPRYATDVDVSARSDSLSSRPRPASIEAILHSPSSSHAHCISDTRLASATDWTAVTSNTDLLVAILTSWTTHEYSYYHYLDREALLDDMASGRTDFCSELLLNALLATACSTCPEVHDRGTPFSEFSIMTAFFKEATRLWDLEPDDRSLTRIQAGICLYLFLGKHGRDKAGHVFLAEACRIGQDLGLFGSESPHATQKHSSIPMNKWSHMRAVTAWTLFNFQLNMSFTYCFPVILKTPPPVAIPYQDTPDLEALFRSECTKYTIILDCVNATPSYTEHFDQEKSQPDPGIVEICYQRLTSWWHSRPSILDPEQVPSQQNLLCAMMYHVNIVNLFQPFLALKIPCIAYFDRVRSVTSTALFNLRRLLALQESRNGWSNTITLILHPLVIASFGSLDEISQAPSDAESSEQYQGLLVCLRALAALCSYNYYAQPLFRLLTQKCVALNLSIPGEVQDALDYYTSEEWTKSAKSLVSSQYIADMRKDAERKRMDAVIEAWDGLSIKKGTGRVNDEKL